jgi:pyruvate/2-oxoglutarate dehydrogenase complex dihydrolipoamide dehydrogenase (E3) component
VTLVEQADGILGREDRDAARIIERALEHDGVEIRVGTKLVRVEKSANGKRLFFQAEAAGDSDVVVDEVLVGVGRAPNVEGLGLEQAGVAYDRHEGVRVDPGLRTTNNKVYAAGDVCLPYKFTHTADAAARIVLRNALFYGRAKSDALHVPWCTYTDPEVAHVGLYEQEAREKGAEVDTFTVQLAEVDRAVLDGETEGFLKVLVKKGSDEIVGATLVSSHAGETITELTAAMVTGSGLGKLADTIHCYPTQAEAIKRAADAFNRTRLTPFVRRVFERLLAWRR